MVYRGRRAACLRRGLTQAVFRGGVAGHAGVGDGYRSSGGRVCLDVIAGMLQMCAHRERRNAGAKTDHLCCCNYRILDVRLFDCLPVVCPMASSENTCTPQWARCLESSVSAVALFCVDGQAQGSGRNVTVVTVPI